MSDKGLRRASTLREVAREAGYDQESADRLIFTPQKFTEEAVHKKLSTALSPQAITQIFDNLAGETGRSSQDIVQLGNTLYEFEKRLGDSAKKDLLEEEEKLLSFTVKLLERSLYSGGLSELTQESAAAMAFLINRLGKIKEIAKPRKERTSFNYTQFQGFVEQVEEFSEEYFSPERYDELIALKEADLGSLEEDMIEKGSAGEKAYVKSVREKRGLEDRLEEMRAGEFWVEIQDLTRRLEKIIELFRRIFGFDSSEVADRDINYFVDTLKSLKEADFLKLLEFKQDLLRGTGNDLYFRYNFVYAVLYLAHPQLRGNDLDDLDIKARRISKAIYQYVDNLAAYKAEHAKDKGKRHKGFSALADMALAEKINDEEIMNTYSDFTSLCYDGGGPCGEAATIVSDLNLMMRNRREYTKKTDAHYNLEREIKLLKTERLETDKYRERVRKAKELVLREVKNRPEGDMYFLKTILVAADMVNLGKLRGRAGFTSEAPRETIASYEMVHLPELLRYGPNAYENLQQYGSKPQPKMKYSDVHYRTDQLPFALMVTKYFKEKE